ncbi:hypothetical protein ACH5RR_041620 [Cinchona calisaya]|uniref:Homeobox domain-containing protein n=1 Tax=Cinchona calisaya TaxID=153742 RepID=A0ABD2XZH4_9GENT
MPYPGGEEKTRSAAMVTTTDYNCYSDASTVNPNIQTTHHVISHHQLQSYDDSSNPEEIYNLTSGMEMIGFIPSRNIINPHEFSSTRSHDESFMVGGGQDHHYDPSIRVVFPYCEGNERRPNTRGLSLSLGSISNHPSSSNNIASLHESFELIRHHQDHDIRDGFFGKSNIMNIQHHQQQIMQDGFLGKASNFSHQGQFMMRSSKYLATAQELLNEFCNLGTKQQSDHHSTSKIKLQKTNPWQDHQDNANSSSKMQTNLYSLDSLELQKRKSKLLQMLEEVDRRYKHYCNQMKAVVSSFEAVAGNGAATVYSALASKAMSRHFRCLRDGIVGQIKATKKALGEKDTAALGTTRGETPRLRILDQSLRQQRAFQQMNMMESHPWRPQRGLPERAVSVLRAWLFEHFLHPYPSDVDKHILARQTGLSRSQVSNWFINARVRLWKPMVEEMYTEEAKEEENNNNTVGPLDDQNPLQDQKPTPDKLVRIDSECLSSIINNKPHEKNDTKISSSSKGLHDHHDIHHSFGRVSHDSFGAMDDQLDFSSYNHHQSYGGSGNGGGGGGGGVSLTLGLQQHGGGNGVSFAAAANSHQNSFFYSRENIHEDDDGDCQQVHDQYSILESEGQNLPYRNLMGAQLLHDLAG